MKGCVRTCPSGRKDCNGTCINVMGSDADNCGDCGVECMDGRVCKLGKCDCPSGTKGCDGTCVYVGSDADNCGDCGKKCSWGRICKGGKCGCVSGAKDCDGICVEVMGSDADNCGDCGVICPAGKVCNDGNCECLPGMKDCDGVCVAVMGSDADNCGDCGVKCDGSADRCVSGVCSCGICDASVNGSFIVDSCMNNRLDAGEEGVDCGGLCGPCRSCMASKEDSECGFGGFCDSAAGYLCSKRCRSDADCNNSHLWDGEYCRKDGRCSPKWFDTIWSVEAGEVLSLPLYNCVYSTPRYEVLWGDEGAGVTKGESFASFSPAHVYAAAGHYRVRIRNLGKDGIFPCWGCKFSGHCEGYRPDRLKQVVSFGPARLGQYAFSNTGGDFPIPERDIPDSTRLVTLYHCFHASGFNGIIRWDTVNVTGMSYMFSGAGLFNREVHFNTSRVTTMSSMFRGASSFNQVVGFDTGNVTDMSSMFDNARSFNQPVVFDTGNVRNISGMFRGAVRFNQSIRPWFDGLDNDVLLKDPGKYREVFQFSGISEENFCALKDVFGENLSVLWPDTPFSCLDISN